MVDSFWAGVVVLALAATAFVLLVLWLKERDARARLVSSLLDVELGEALKARVGDLEQRVAGVEALLVSTVGQETEAFCRAMDALMDKMDAQKEEQRPAQEGPKLVLSEKYCGVFKAPKPDKRRGGKKGAGRG